MKLDIEAEHVRGKSRLREIIGIVVDTDDVGRPAPFHLDRIEAAVAADIEDTLAGEIGGKGMGKTLPFHCGVIAERMIPRRPPPIQIHVVEPRPKRLDPLTRPVAIQHLACRRAHLRAHFRPPACSSSFSTKLESRPRGAASVPMRSSSWIAAR